METIKFRGKNKNDDWVEGYYCKFGFVGNEKYYIIPYYASALYAIEINPETVGQFTGITDKNGEETFEGDILHTNYHSECDVEVVFNDGRYAMKFLHNHGYHCKGEIDCNCFCQEMVSRLSKIGNIYDNPELLESEELK
jgi:uncharacterized phage protein (TIGR01671 family)